VFAESTQKATFHSWTGLPYIKGLIVPVVCVCVGVHACVRVCVCVCVCVCKALTVVPSKWKTVYTCVSLNMATLKWFLLCCLVYIRSVRQ